MRNCADRGTKGLRVTKLFSRDTPTLPLFLLDDSPFVGSTMQEVHSRKRPHLGDSDPLPSKKRAVSVNGTTVLVNGNVHPNTAADDEPRDQDSLEVSSIFSFIALVLVSYFIILF